MSIGLCSFYTELIDSDLNPISLAFTCWPDDFQLIKHSKKIGNLP